jgi:hypothetical protein
MDADVSWGHTGYGDQSCVEAFSQSAIDTFIEGIDGAGALMAIDPYGEDPSEVFFQGDLFRDAWSNLGQTLGAIGFSVPTLITQKIGKENVWPWLADASTWTEEKLTALAYGFVGTEDEWEDNPARASGALAMGLASILATKGGGGAKAASTASRVASVVEKASALLKRTEHLGDDGITSGAVKSSTVISELAESLEKSLVGGAKDADLNLGKTIDDLNTKLDDSTSVLTDRRPGIDPPEGKNERAIRESGEYRTVPSPDPTPVADVARAIHDQPSIGSHEGGPGEWKLTGRNAHGMEDQEFATGVRHDGSGRVPEYFVDLKGKDVEFDGFQKRGDPPVEVYQEVKGDYDFAHSKFTSVKAQINSWVAQATRQAEAIHGRGAEHQWIFTRNPELAQQVAQRFEDAGLDVDVLYVPKVT